MKQIISIAQAIIVGAIALFSMCSTAPLAGGNSSQTGNNGITVSASAKNVSGTTQRGAHISLYEQNYRPYIIPSGFCDSIVADDSGRFNFSIVKEGYYNLLAQSTQNGAAAFVPRIPVFTDSVFSDTVDTLKQPGFLAGNATDTAGRTYALSYIFIDGSPFYTVTKNNGEFLLGPLPAGTYTIGFFANFQVVDKLTGQMVQMASALLDTTVITIVPGGVSAWNW
jgi:hypothetical protein